MREREKRAQEKRNGGEKGSGQKKKKSNQTQKKKREQRWKTTTLPRTKRAHEKTEKKLRGWGKTSLTYPFKEPQGGGGSDKNPNRSNQKAKAYVPRGSNWRRKKEKVILEPGGGRKRKKLVWKKSKKMGGENNHIGLL